MKKDIIKRYIEKETGYYISLSNSLLDYKFSPDKTAIKVTYQPYYDKEKKKPLIEKYNYFPIAILVKDLEKLENEKNNNTNSDKG